MGLPGKPNNKMVASIVDSASAVLGLTPVSSTKSITYYQNGVGNEQADYTGRIDLLRKTPAKTKFLSLEPLLGSPGELDLSGIDWVIAGGESAL